MLANFPLPFYFIIGGLISIFLPKGVIKSSFVCLVPVAALLALLTGTWEEEGMIVPFLDLELDFMRVDKLSNVFGIIFCIAAFLGNLFAFHLRENTQPFVALIYAGAAIGAVFAGDLVTLFVYWELTAISSVFLIWARRTEGAYHSGMRYLIIQVLSGVILLFGVALFYSETGSIAFTKMELGNLSTILIFIAFGIKCAFPFMHNWLQDSYPSATITGTVILSAFTTKLAVYALARGFPGTELLIYIGAAMTVFPIFFAEVENDLRKVLAYSLNNQLGFMVVGIGVGTELALNGTAAHAFSHILYKALLFMSVGAVLFRTGTSRASELGGLYKTMPLTAIFCLIGAASISAFPLFSGFVSKSLIMSGAGKEHYQIIWLILVFASAGVLSHSGIKVPYFTFFHHDSGKRPSEAPAHMLFAMGLTSVLCIYIGIFPNNLYAIMPYQVKYEPYTFEHILTQLQLLCFAILAFYLLSKFKQLPPETRSINLDFDWTYRTFLPSVIGKFLLSLESTEQKGLRLFKKYSTLFLNKVYHITGPEGVMTRILTSGTMVLFIAIVLLIVLGIILF
jgi:multicomponent Na+:H+ antiporter subunit D